MWAFRRINKEKMLLVIGSVTTWWKSGLNYFWVGFVEACKLKFLKVLEDLHAVASDSTLLNKFSYRLTIYFMWHPFEMPLQDNFLMFYEL
jgi:hypothetical protein